MNNIKIVVAEASYLIQKGLGAILKKLGDNLIVQEMDKAEGLFESFSSFNPDILILNPDLFESSTELLKEDCAKLGDCKLVIISNGEELESKYSADAFLHYNDGQAKIISCLEGLKDELIKKNKKENSSEPISAREKNILKHIALGLTNKEIADQLFISIHTVVTHRKNITHKLGIKSVSGLTVYAILNDLIAMDEVK
ncbi:response regulator transcription factor [Ancylomarina sp. 16SWW S1-10-2]|uniref:response regulator transcription factor n=1 Tax=Ancylomarina sp. 16SWW S1-10-2 TaxID=2499681 RepID=UPI0012AE8EDA|nr:response regulator transcription factor [Ancylomarina sp. 16SWW S1-10-2]MRT94491.1 response regulator transcription factor [Ancylomarina sp. 16SWW S1-10-2]